MNTKWIYCVSVIYAYCLEKITNKTSICGTWPQSNKFLIYFLKFRPSIIQKNWLTIRRKKKIPPPHTNPPTFLSSSLFNRCYSPLSMRLTFIFYFYTVIFYSTWCLTCIMSRRIHMSNWSIQVQISTCTYPKLNDINMKWRQVKGRIYVLCVKFLKYNDSPT